MRWRHQKKRKRRRPSKRQERQWKLDKLLDKLVLRDSTKKALHQKRKIKGRVYCVAWRAQSKAFTELALQKLQLFPSCLAWPSTLCTFALDIIIASVMNKPILLPAWLECPRPRGLCHLVFQLSVFLSFLLCHLFLSENHKGRTFTSWQDGSISDAKAIMYWR